MDHSDLSHYFANVLDLRGLDHTPGNRAAIAAEQIPHGPGSTYAFEPREFTLAGFFGPDTETIVPDDPECSEWVKVFTRGQCHAFAAACSAILYGNPDASTVGVKFFDYCGEVAPDHFMVRLPDGRFFDVNGPTDLPTDWLSEVEPETGGELWEDLPVEDRALWQWMTIEDVSHCYVPEQAADALPFAAAKLREHRVI